MWQDQPCKCGSGKSRYELLDVHRIFCAYVCEDCEAKERAKYRPEIFTDYNYETDDRIEPLD